MSNCLKRYGDTPHGVAMFFDSIAISSAFDEGRLDDICDRLKISKFNNESCVALKELLLESASLPTDVSDLTDAQLSMVKDVHVGLKRGDCRDVETFGKTCGGVDVRVARRNERLIKDFCSSEDDLEDCEAEEEERLADEIMNEVEVGDNKNKRRRRKRGDFLNPGDYGG